MNKLLKKDLKGFTIIEVVIVLAIAALIIVIVLLAVNALQKSQRTKAAQDAGGRLLSQMNNWETALGGDTPIQPNDVMPNTYFTSARMPNGYTSAPVGTRAAANGVNDFVYGPGTCVAGNNALNGAIAANASATQFAVSYWSENAGRPVCLQN